MSTERHTIRWIAYTADGPEPRRAHHQARTGYYAFDATCSCGWESFTGGAISVRVAEAVAEHKAHAEFLTTTNHDAEEAA